MTRIVRSALVPRPASTMFDIVNDVEAYPRRFAWCPGAAVLERAAEELVARMQLRFGGMTTAFTTRNRFERPSAIAIELVEGPFTALTGAWRFQPLGDDGCKVSLDLDFEMSGKLVGSALAIGFQKLADRMVDEFVRAALAT
jgi:ribosome-associated toxin RatA of RatAB toxin-antitoxin module